MAPTREADALPLAASKGLPESSKALDHSIESTCHVHRGRGHAQSLLTPPPTSLGQRAAALTSYGESVSLCGSPV